MTRLKPEQRDHPLKFAEFHNQSPLLTMMKSILESSLTDLKRSLTADSHLKEIKRLKFDEPHRFKKKGNEDQYRFNLRVDDAIEEAKEACSSQFFQVSACSMTSRRSRPSRTVVNCF